MNRICRPGFGREPSAKCKMHNANFTFLQPLKRAPTGCKNAGDFVKEYFSFVLEISVFGKP